MFHSSHLLMKLHVFRVEEVHLSMIPVSVVVWMCLFSNTNVKNTYTHFCTCTPHIYVSDIWKPHRVPLPVTPLSSFASAFTTATITTTTTSSMVKFKSPNVCARNPAFAMALIDHLHHVFAAAIDSAVTLSVTPAKIPQDGSLQRATGGNNILKSTLVAAATMRMRSQGPTYSPNIASLSDSPKLPFPSNITLNTSSSTLEMSATYDWQSCFPGLRMLAVVLDLQSAAILQKVCDWMVSE